ncbi:MAG TPA: FliI/YscN family ATPase [Hyphomonadaceae bacterium]|jgi:FliI/YscN family ATPase|nr:FliI/YscN family ATPase [Hyphomonadaceae bacterium]
MISHPLVLQIASLSPARRVGYVRKVSPGRIETSGPLASVGDICEIASADAGGAAVLAEVAAVHEEHLVLVSLDPTAPIAPEAEVVVRPTRNLGPVGDAFAGRAVDAMGQPIDGGGAILSEAMAPLEGRVLAPLERLDPNRVLETGVRALDGLLTLGHGQRIGILAAAGVGKTTLMRQLATQATADRCILCLVGERGREVEGIWRDLASRADRNRFTCVAATSDLSAPLRVRSVHQALCLAEHWRAKGEHVLLIVDSVTRYAMALREIGLAAGAPPTLRAYTPNVFAALPRLVERCGGASDGGSITAVITVLSETDDVDDPIVEIMKSLLDGHIVLSRQLAEQGHFPAIDVLRSVSRQSGQLMNASHAPVAKRTLGLLAAYDDARLMIEGGIYKSGTNAHTDEAIRAREPIAAFLKQRHDERTPPAETFKRLVSAVQNHA